MERQYPAAALRPGARACIIGAGCSGLTAAKALLEQGVPYDHFEMGAAIGGNWRYGNDNGRSSAYRTLHIISSRENMQFSDFPMPEDFPDYGHHSDVLDYFERYAEHFGVTKRITFNTKVTRVVPAANDAWDVTTRGPDGEEATQTYGAVLIANGHHWCPRTPDFPGTFDGEAMHSHDYREPHELAEKRVLVVGMGNSACDIAIDACRIAGRTVVSTRSSAHIIPKYLLGRPTDHWTSIVTDRLPAWGQAAILRALTYLTAGNQERYGVPLPEHGVMAAHPTLNQEFLAYVGHGRVKVRANVERLDGDGVVFADGTREAFDLIIYATGYHIRFPFLPDRVFAVGEDNELSLYRNVVDPSQPGLYFVGLVQPIGAIMPLSEVQGQWVAGLLAGEMALPSVPAMHRDIAKRKAEVARRYTKSPRHTIQVSFWKYRNRVREEMRRARRVRRRTARKSAAA